MAETLTTTFDEHALAALPEAAGFTAPLRKQAFEEFSALPIPSQETEEWRYTDLSDFALDFTPYTPGGRAQNLDDVPAEILAAAGAVGERAGLLIQHDSDVMLSHLDPALAAKGVLFTDLDAAAAEHPDLIGNALHSLVPTDRSKFLAMHGAFRTGGTFLYVPRDTVVELPLQTLTWLDADGIAVFPHTLIVVEAGAEVTFIERFASPDLTRAFSNAVTEIVVGEGARVDHFKLQRQAEGAFHVSTLAVELGRDATFSDHNVCVGGALVRQHVEARFAGPGGDVALFGLSIGDGTQHHDTHTVVDHAVPHCTSRELYKGVLGGRSRGVFHGKIVVREDAQKTNAHQSNRNLLLSRNALVNSTPALEIHADDVKCKHGSTTGQLDPLALFYLRSRGIGEQEAKGLLTYAFASDLVSRITVQPVRVALEAFLHHRLPASPTEAAS